MSTVIATYLNGSTREMPESHAKVLQHVGQIKGYAAAGSVPAPGYMTRAMVAAPPPQAPQPQYRIKVDGADVVLDDMERDALHELAEKMGVKVHHLAGAPKVRAALIEAQVEADGE